MARASPRWSGLLLLVALGAVGVAAARPRPAHQRTVDVVKGDASYRLPTTVSPKHYEIFINPNLVGKTFIGHVDITITSTLTTGKLVMHADSLTIISCTLNGTKLNSPQPDLVRQFITFDLSTAKQPMHPNEDYVLSCDYSGKIWEDDKGFYLSSYKENNLQRSLGVTQFEMTFARRAFPAFDEPGFRSTFTLSMKHFKNMRAVSNTRPTVISVKDPQDGKVTTTFEKTPRMACYTLAWLLSEMPAVEDADGDFRTFAPPTVLAETATSQSLGPKVLSHMGRYTGIPYLLDKMDQVAVPDFNFGAMENWGMVTYRQAMLLDQRDSRTLTNLTVATTIAHELAHQWFGNLVTPSWWQHVWLSEAFAELFCYLVVDQVHPDWKVMDKMSLMEMQDAFVDDALMSSNPMTHEVYTPDEILDNFGSVTYAKGSSVLRMLRQYLGEDVFRAGIQNYLNNMREIGSVHPSDLWEGLAQAVAESGSTPSVDIATVGFTWVDLAGYPVVSVAVDDAGQVSFSQTRFFSRSGEISAQVWQVPVVWRAAGAATPSSFLLGTMHDVAADTASGADWVLANVDQIGYYRVNYEPSNWAALSSALASSVDTFSVAERSMLVDDALTLARAGQLDYNAALGLVEYLPSEEHYAPWASFEAAVDYLAMHFRAAPGEDKTAFNKWVQDLVHERYNQLGLTSGPKDTFEDKLTRTVVARLAVEAEFSTAVDEAYNAYLNWDSDMWMEPDTLRLVLCQQLKDTSSAMYPPGHTFRDLLKRLVDSDDEAERQDYTYALGCAPQTDEYPLKHKLLDTMLDAHSGITLRDWRALWKAVSSSSVGLTLALDTAYVNYKLIEENFGADEMQTVFSTLATRVVAEDDFEKLKDLQQVIHGSAEVLDKALDNLSWRTLHYADVAAYLKDTPTPAPTTMSPSSATSPASSSTSPASSATSPASSATSPASSATSPASSATSKATPATSTVTPASTSASPPTTQAPTPDPSYFRLRDQLAPNYYILTLTPNMEAKTFQATMAMTFTVNKDDEIDENDVINLHSSGLQFAIDDVKVTWPKDSESETENQIPVVSVVFREDLEQVSIALEDSMTPDTVNYTVAISYSGALREDLTGLYITDFGTGKLVGTQLYPAYARRVLPCLDEPKYRASMYLTVVHAPNQVAVSNTPALDDPIPVDDDTVMDAFEPTERIAASQLSLVLADAALMAKTPAGDDGSFLTLRGLQAVLDKADGTLDTANAIWGWFANLTATNGSMEQVNIVGLDNSLEDGAAGWGLITLRSSDLADLDNSTSSGASEQTWLTQLGRFVSQLWFGNLVGVSWWDGAWLQQGFATYYQYAVAAELQPHWQMEAQLYTRAVVPAMHADSLEGTRALGAAVVGTQDSIAEALDDVAAGKGAAVVQMLQHVLEKGDAFDAGLKNYFADNALEAASEDALYTAMQAAVLADSTLLPPPGLAAAFKTWVDSAGYPVLTVIRDYENANATVTQERFLLASSGTDLPASWWAPVSYALKSEYLNMRGTPKVPVKAWLGPEEPLAVDLAGEDAAKDWVLVNADRRDFYRVNYDVKNWELLHAFLKEYTKLLQPVARASLVDDALALARAGRLDYAVALDVVDYLRLDSDLAPWEAARAAFDYLDAQFLESPHQAVYQTWLLQLLDHAFQENGFQPEDRNTHTQRLARAVVTAWACEAGNAFCRRYALADFAKWMQDADSVGHDTLAATVCEGVRRAPVDGVVAKLVAEPEDSTRSAIIRGLGCAADTAAVLSLAANKGLRKGESAKLYESVSRFGPSSVTKALAHFQTNHPTVIQAYGRGEALGVIGVLANRATTADQVAVLKNIVNAMGSTVRTQSLVALAQANVQWRAANLDNTADILYSLTGTPVPDTTTAASSTGTSDGPSTAATTHAPTHAPKPTPKPNSAGSLASSGLLLAAVLAAAVFGARP